VKGKYEILTADGKSVANGPLGYNYVLRESVRDFHAELKEQLPKGKYTVRIAYTSPQLKTAIAKDFSLAYEPAPPAKDKPADKAAEKGPDKPKPAKTEPTTASPKRSNTAPRRDENESAKGKTSGEPPAAMPDASPAGQAS